MEYYSTQSKQESFSRKKNKNLTHYDSTINLYQL